MSRMTEVTTPQPDESEDDVSEADTAPEPEAPRRKKKIKRRAPAETAAPPRPQASGLDERSLARGVAIGLPLVTATLASTAAVLIGPPMALLVLVAGVMLGVIALLWASLRVLSGDAPLSPELEELEAASRGVDALASRKKMLLRALKDLDNERAIGKLEDDDYEQVAAVYRTELKDVLRRIDEELAPHLGRAEELALSHLVRTGVLDAGYRGAPPPESDAAPPKHRREARAPATEDAVAPTTREEGREDVSGTERVSCPTCEASNEADAKFCKGCGATLDREEGAVEA